MQQTVSIRLRIIPDSCQAELLKRTMKVYSEACNYVSDYIFRTHDLTQSGLQKALYYSIRESFSLPAQMAQSVMRTAISAFKTILTNEKKWIMPVVYACMNMAKSKTGALIVVQQTIPLTDYERTGDMINADINSRLIENIFFKNSPLHDGALIINGSKIMSAGCILPVSHDTNIPRYLGLRHLSAKGIAQATDAIAIVVSEESGRISYAHKGELHLNLSSTELEHALSALIATE